jgi:hypothetical protein
MFRSLIHLSSGFVHTISDRKVKCWFRKRRRNLHQESGAECTIEEETKAFKQFIVDHAAGRTIPSIILQSNGPKRKDQNSMVSSPGTSFENGGLELQIGGQKIPVPHPLIAIPMRPVNGQEKLRKRQQQLSVPENPNRKDLA